jgi:SSS family solute:Na+ symporter
MTYHFIAFVVILFSIFLIIGYKTGKSIYKKENYFLANRKLGVFSISMSLLATQLGGVVILGASEFSYKYGIYGIFYTLGLALGLMSIAFFGAKQLREKNIATIPELFEKEYDSLLLRKIASVLSIVSLYGILISLIVGTRKFLIAFGVDNELVIYAFWVLLIAYTVMGGIKAVIYTDVIQIIVIFIIFIAITMYYILMKFEYIQFSLDNLFNVQSTDNISFFPYIFVPFLYVFIEQDMAQRFFTAKNSKVAYTSAFLAGALLLIFSFIPVLFGIAARSIGKIPSDASAMVFFFTQTADNFTISMVTIGILCAIISTGDSLLCAISSNLTLDFKGKNRGAVKDSLIYTRFATIALGVMAIFIAHYFDNIIKVVLVSYEIMVCTLFFPIVVTYLSFKNSTAFAYISIMLGIIGFFLYTKFTEIIGYSITKELFCILLSFLSFPLAKIYDSVVSSKIICKNTKTSA